LFPNQSFKVPEYTNSGYFGTKKHTDWSV